MDGPEVLDPYCNPDKPVKITFDEITSAAYRIKSGTRNTECSRSEHLSNLTGMEIYIKKEFLQATGSFKERGARYAMIRMSPEMRKKGIVASSAGNHAQACCYHGKMLGLPVTVLMPETAPIMKIEKCKNYGGNVIIQGKNLTETKKIALAYAKDNGMMYLNGFDHPDILAGQGTVGLEIWEQIPGLEAVVVPVGGGGLLAGICVAIKSLDDSIKVIGTEPERACCLTEALKVGKPVEVKLESTLADGLSVGKIGVNVFESIKNILDKCVTVKEQYIASSILRILEDEKCVVEGAGAITLAAIMQGSLPELKGKKVCLILSGGNIDSTVLGRVIERGLAADGRLIKVKVCISDRIGGIEDLVNSIGNLGVHIKDLVHERAWVIEDVFKVEVKVTCECRDMAHSLALRDALVKMYGTIFFNGLLYPDNDATKSKDIPYGESPQKASPQTTSAPAQKELMNLELDSLNYRMKREMSPEMTPTGAVDLESENQEITSSHLSQAVEGASAKQLSESVRLSQQINPDERTQQAPLRTGTTTPSQNVSFATEQQEVGSQHPSSALDEDRVKQAGTQLGNTQHAAVGTERKLSSCACKRRGDPGEYEMKDQPKS